ncbi:uncharacterized protein BJ171DRAFT_199367 [Polychytrium aggregatum]|uniref:uncharacterized protein n=1 Tax=Polychytrium aggregatum TaxID=110093 RepID=UPI0022FE652A|nr:uncharacterized protein BJ171DRAFT_199367 [Polychytrium aggregatum]KAI9199870.1 hypothetical protein BJ171DRAFT_199367 [Polychytrium aggregatum]
MISAFGAAVINPLPYSDPNQPETHPHPFRPAASELCHNPGPTFETMGSALPNHDHPALYYRHPVSRERQLRLRAPYHGPRVDVFSASDVSHGLSITTHTLPQSEPHPPAMLSLESSQAAHAIHQSTRHLSFSATSPPAPLDIYLGEHPYPFDGKHAFSHPSEALPGRRPMLHAGSNYPPRRVFSAGLPTFPGPLHHFYSHAEPYPQPVEPHIDAYGRLWSQSHGLLEPSELSGHLYEPTTQEGLSAAQDRVAIKHLCADSYSMDVSLDAGDKMFCRASRSPVLPLGKRRSQHPLQTLTVNPNLAQPTLIQPLSECTVDADTDEDDVVQINADAGADIDVDDNGDIDDDIDVNVNVNANISVSVSDDDGSDSDGNIGTEVNVCTWSEMRIGEECFIAKGDDFQFSNQAVKIEALGPAVDSSTGARNETLDRDGDRDEDSQDDLHYQSELSFAGRCDDGVAVCGRPSSETPEYGMDILHLQSASSATYLRTGIDGEPSMDSAEDDPPVVTKSRSSASARRILKEVSDEQVSIELVSVSIDGIDDCEPVVAPKRQRHVGKACIHCKKAHLACDSGRPCRRCKHMGKTDCIDVEHKKRGRPRSIKRD